MSAKTLAVIDGEQRASVPSVIVCPRCSGQVYDRGSCQMCANAGYLSEDGDTLSFAERVQMLATLSLSTGIPLGKPEAATGKTTGL